MLEFDAVPCVQGQSARNQFTRTNSHLFFLASSIRHDKENRNDMLNKLIRNKCKKEMKSVK